MAGRYSLIIHRIKDLAIYMLVIVTGFVVRRLPRSASLRLGTWIGDLVYRSVKRRRQIALNNLRMALGSEKGDEELKQIARRSFRNMGKTLVEFLSFPKYSAERLPDLMRIEGAENFHQAFSARKGVIVVPAHFGNWEFVFRAMNLLADDSSAVVQSFKYHRLDRLVNSYRTRYGGTVIKKEMAVKQTLRLLRRGLCVGIMGDQNAGDSGVFVDFFGIPASTARGPIMFALRTGASVLSMFDIRQDDNSHLITISEPLELETLGDLESNVKVNTAQLVKQLEKIVREYPCQWLWMHNRWKTRPGTGCSMLDAGCSIGTRQAQRSIPSSGIKHSVLILSDGKPGHYNQSLGIMGRMRDMSVKTIQVRFKRKWRDNLLRISTRFLAGIKLPRRLIEAMLEWAMESSSAAAALGAGHFDAILSTGSSVAAPNLLLGQLMGAKTAVCNRPSPVGINHFDLAILPEHMRPRRSGGASATPVRRDSQSTNARNGHIGNTVMTLGVPNRITPEYVGIAGRHLAKKLKAAGQPIIGLLLGGDDRHYSIPPGMTSLLCDTLLDICKKNGARLALTTSRRTDPESEGIVRSKISRNSLCCFSVLASEPQQENPVPSILGISDVTIVTEDSFSMVCEAVSSGRKIVIMDVERRKQGHLKRQRVYNLLTQRGYAKKADVANLGNVILDLVREATEPKALDDAQTAADALRDLINGKG